VTRLIRFLAYLKLVWFLVWFTISAGSLLSWEILRLVTTPISYRWKWKRRIAPVAISATVITVVLMMVRFAHFAKLI
jgi:hypothetical protein